MHRSSGFTLIEMVVVLLLMGIIAVTVLGRSITTSDLDLNSETDKIRNHLRYAQAEAMKRSNTVWGIKCNTESGMQYYWLFNGINPDLEANQVRLPGVNYAGTNTRATTADFGVTLNDFTVFFNRIGKPYTSFMSFTDETQNTPVSTSNPLAVTVTAGSQNRTFTVTPETGLIR